MKYVCLVHFVPQMLEAMSEAEKRALDVDLRHSPRMTRRRSRERVHAGIVDPTILELGSGWALGGKAQIELDVVARGKRPTTGGGGRGCG